jgi:hypothetical protein
MNTAFFSVGKFLDIFPLKNHQETTQKTSRFGVKNYHCANTTEKSYVFVWFEQK